MNACAVLVTGASGFVGKALVHRLQQEPDILPRQALRTIPDHLIGNDVARIGDIGPDTDWSAAVAGINVIVHCAARVHVMNHADSSESLKEFRRVNVAGTQNLARQAAKAGVSRLIFVSSIKVNGETTTGLPPFSHLDQPAPLDAYGISKWEAEQALWTIGRETGMEVVVVRPPLVYGPGVKANFLRLMQAIRYGIPLPFGRVNNLRSMVYVENLADLLATCITHPKAAGQTLMVSDGQDFSTKALVTQLAMAMERKPALFNCPLPLMAAVARLINKEALADRLLGSLQVDTNGTHEVLGWTPPCTAENGIKATAKTFKQATSE